MTGYEALVALAALRAAVEVYRIRSGRKAAEARAAKGAKR